MSDDDAERLLDLIAPEPDQIAPGLRRCSMSEARVLYGFNGKGRVAPDMVIFENNKEGLRLWLLAGEKVADYQKSLEPSPIEAKPTSDAKVPEGVVIRRLAYGR